MLLAHMMLIMTLSSRDTRMVTWHAFHFGHHTPTESAGDVRNTVRLMTSRAAMVRFGDRIQSSSWATTGCNGVKDDRTRRIRKMPAVAQIMPAEALRLEALITPTPQGIASRVLSKTPGGNVTVFAFDAGQGLTRHTSPFEALVLVLSGALDLTIGGAIVRATPGTIVRMPGNVPHAVDALEATRMLLIMLR
jgi:quercetin dioxygenase-like cupin family protein